MLNKLFLIIKHPIDMKLTCSCFVFVSLLITAFTSCTQSAPKDGSYSFEIYSTNDIHGRYFDSLYVAGDDGVFTHKYSLASVSSVVNESRQKVGSNNVIFLDMGDHIQGDNAPFYYSFVDTTSQHVFSRIANYMKYDAIVVGNHDIEVGHSVYDRIVTELDMPYLAANAIDNDTNMPYFEPYTIVNKQGVKIAVIGLTNPNIPSWLAPELWSGMNFQSIVPTLEHWIEYVKENEKPHFIIAAIHSGLGNEDEDDIENVGRYVAKHVDGVDLVLASHDHRVAAERYNNNGKDVWLLEGGSRAYNLSKATLNFNIRDGLAQDISINAQTIDMTGVTPDSVYLSQLRDAFVEVKKFTNTEVGILLNDIDSRDAYFGPSAYVDMIHSLQLKASGADISFAAPLSFDKHIASGKLNYQNLMDIYPFENQLNVIGLSGKEIKDYLEYSYAYWLNPNPQNNGHLLNVNDGQGERFKLKSPHFNFDSAAGIIYEVDITKPVSQRINIISLVNGAIFDLNKIYTVALTSYRASGGGDLLTKGSGIAREDLQSRIVARLADIREIMYNQIQLDGVLKADKLNHWKFVPEDLSKKLSEADYNMLFR